MIKFFKEPGYKVKNPSRDIGNAGIDFYIPEYTSKFADDFSAKNIKDRAALELWTNTDTGEQKWVLKVNPHCDVNIPSGIHSFIDSDTGLIAVNKSGIASKQKLVVGACLIDPNYQGIIHCHLINTSDNVVFLSLGQKITQFVPYKFDTSAHECVEEGTLEDFYKEMIFNNRGNGAFGSTGIN